jgi:hypothetical protein
MRKWDVERYTLSQICNALSEPKEHDPHAGGKRIYSLAEIDDLV